MLLSNNSTQLIYLSCCEGGASSEFTSLDTTFNGLLHSTLMAGVPAAIGMRWPIKVNDAKDLACAFYENLFSNSNTSIEVALMNARKTVYPYPDKTVWSSPILIKNSIHHE
jgi:CHAT domain-containing protein